MSFDPDEPYENRFERFPNGDLFSVQQGDRRIEFYAKRRREFGSLLLIAVWGAAMAFLAFSLGVSHGVDEGADACAAGDMVAVDRNVGGA